jgi:uncharacterized repeat protein (TIGR01451 family)
LKEISIDGGVTWFDANTAATGPTATAPSDAEYRITVYNTGDTEIENVTVNDTALAGGPWAVPNLAPGGQYVLDAGTFPELYVVDRCTIAGEFENVADVAANPVLLPSVPLSADDPAWLTCIKPDPCELTLDLQCALPPPPTGLVCTTRPMEIVFEYTGDDCTATTNQQEGRVLCTSDAAPLAADVDITYVGSDAGLITISPIGGNLWALTAPEKLQSNSPLEIRDLNGNLLQSISMHTSCSKPLAVGDQFGAMKLVEMTEPDGTVIGGVPAGPDWQDDCTVYNDRTECTKRSTALGFRFNAGNCDDAVGGNTQDSGKYACTDIGGGPLGLPGPFQLQFNSGSGVYKTIQVSPGDEFEVLASEDGRSDFASQTDWDLYDETGTTLLQTGTFHTSCSQNLFIGDLYGNLEVVSFTNSEQGFVTANNEIDLRYTITNTGIPAIDYMCAGDDNATPADTSDDVVVTPIDCATNSDPMNPGAVRQYERTAQLTGDSTFMAWATAENATDPAEVCVSADAVTVLVMTPPTPEASCDTGKPKALLFEYTGDNCSATTNTQEGKAKCEDLVDPAGPGVGPVMVKYTGKGSKHITVTPSGEDVVAGGTSEVWIEATGGKSKKGSKMESNTKLEITQGGVVLQKLEIHTSCSKPLNVGDQFGSLILKAFVPK